MRGEGCRPWSGDVENLKEEISATSRSQANQEGHTYQQKTKPACPGKAQRLSIAGVVHGCSKAIPDPFESALPFFMFTHLPFRRRNPGRRLTGSHRRVLCVVSTVRPIEHRLSTTKRCLSPSAATLFVSYPQSRASNVLQSGQSRWDAAGDGIPMLPRRDVE